MSQAGKYINYNLTFLEPFHLFLVLRGMKLLIIILGILLALSCQAQLDVNILLSADSLLGKKVGDGWCRDFIQEVLNQNGARISIDHRVDSVQAGDVITLFDCMGKTFYDPVTHNFYLDYTGNHIAMIYKVLGKGKYLIMDQNSDGGKRKNTKVIVTDLDLNEIVTGTVMFFRPYKTKDGPGTLKKWIKKKDYKRPS